MLVIDRDCPVCDAGLIGFVVADDGCTLYLWCDECFSVWTNPEEIRGELAVGLEPPDYFLPRSAIRGFGKNSHFATRTEVRKAGLENYVASEEKARGE